MQGARGEVRRAGRGGTVEQQRDAQKECPIRRPVRAETGCARATVLVRPTGGTSKLGGPMDGVNVPQHRRPRGILCGHFVLVGIPPRFRQCLAYLFKVGLRVWPDVDRFFTEYQSRLHVPAQRWVQARSRPQPGESRDGEEEDSHGSPETPPQAHGDCQRCNRARLGNRRSRSEPSASMGNPPRVPHRHDRDDGLHGPTAWRECEPSPGRKQLTGSR